MGQTSNREPRRVWEVSETRRARVPCASCGAPARPHSSDVPFCVRAWIGRGRAASSNGMIWAAATDLLSTEQM